MFCASKDYSTLTHIVDEYCLTCPDCSEGTCETCHVRKLMDAADPKVVLRLQSREYELHDRDIIKFKFSDGYEEVVSYCIGLIDASHVSITRVHKKKEETPHTLDLHIMQLGGMITSSPGTVEIIRGTQKTTIKEAD